MDILAHNTTVWVAFSFILFILLFIKFAGKKIAGALDSKIAEIRTQIDTAEKLKAEAQALLTEYEEKHRDAEMEAGRIIEQAKASAMAMQQAAEAELAETMARREEQLSDRIRRIEEKAIAEIQNHAAELAMKATTEIVTRSMNEQMNARLVDESIQSVAKNFN